MLLNGKIVLLGVYQHVAAVAMFSLSCEGQILRKIGSETEKKTGHQASFLKKRKKKL